jgi:hypothetical protein
LTFLINLITPGASFCRDQCGAISEERDVR